jgi:hypothetical protein
MINQQENEALTIQSLMAKNALLESKLADKISTIAQRDSLLFQRDSIISDKEKSITKLLTCPTLN